MNTYHKNFLSFGLFVYCFLAFSPFWVTELGAQEKPANARVYVLPLRDDVEPSMVYLVRRGVREAMEQKADLLIVHLNTNGGRVDCTEDIMEILGRFEGRLGVHTLIDTKALSAGAFISSATKQIWMTPGSIIGAATPVMIAPGAGGAQQLPESYQRKINSAMQALIRASAEKNGHRPEVFNTMVDNPNGLIVDGKTVVPKGELVTLTHTQAETKYGQPAKPLLSSGTVASLDVLIKKLAGEGAVVNKVEPTGFEQVARLVTMASPLLMGLGLLLGYLEFKTPGFGLFGIGAAICFGIYFFGHYVAGLSGHEAALLFGFGIALIAVEFFIFPGLIFPALVGFTCIAVGLMMAMADILPQSSGPFDWNLFRHPLQVLLLTIVGSVGAGWVLIRSLPQRWVTGGIANATVVGAGLPETESMISVGTEGKVITPLRPSGRAEFEGQIIDVVSEGQMIEAGVLVKVVQSSTWRVVVAPVQNTTKGV